MVANKVVERIVQKCLQESGFEYEVKQTLLLIINTYHDAVVKNFVSIQDAIDYVYATPSNFYQNVFYDDESVFVIRSDKQYQQILVPTIKNFVNEGREQQISELIKNYGVFMRSMREEFKKVLLCKRKYNTKNAGESEMPEEKVLQRFYECERKQVYDTESEALLSVSSGNGVYQCGWCEKWHQGKIPTGIFVSHEIKLQRWISQWQRSFNTILISKEK